MITLTQQIKAVRKAKSVGPLHAKALKAAEQTLAAINLIVSNPRAFEIELENHLTNLDDSKFTSTTQDVIQFLKSKGLPI
jgi:hypothetical protein